MNGRFQPLAILVTASLVGPPSAPAQDGALDSTVSRQSYVRARDLVDRALELTGGRAALVRLGGLTFRATGTLNKGAEHQGKRPGAASPGEFRETFSVDPDAERIAYEYREDRYDGTFEWLREIYRGEHERLIVVLGAGFAVSLISPQHGLRRNRLYRRIPGLLLAEAADNAASLRRVGREAGRDVVLAVLEGGLAVTLFFDSESGVLSRVEYLTDIQSFGDATVAWEFDDYAPVDGLGLFPRRYSSYVEGRPFTDMTVQEVSPGARAGLFALPDGYGEPNRVELPEAADASRDAVVNDVGDGVYVVRNLRGGFHPMFIEFDDFVVAIDAPAGYRLLGELPAGDVAPGPSSAWLSERYLQLIRETVPNKPVRYVVVTHFHNDHAGGVRAFVAEGATVLASPTAAAAIRQLVRAPHTRMPDRLARAPRPLRLEIVDGTRSISDGRRSLEIIDVGRNPHTSHMLIAHLPDQDLIFVSDLMDGSSLEDFPSASHAPLDRFFADWLERRGLRPDRIFTMHGSGLVTPEHLERLRGDDR